VDQSLANRSSETAAAPQAADDPLVARSELLHLREDAVTLGLLIAAVALSSLWLIGLVTVVRWLL
jgi:hypothetical protein